MFDRFQGKENKLVVGVPFSKEASNLLKSAESFAERSQLTLCLVHASEYPTMTYVPYPGDLLTHELLHRSEETVISEDMAALGSLSQNLKPTITKELWCAVGPPATILIAEGEKRHASAIVCGFKPWIHKYTPRGLSTVLTLIAESSMPVLAIPDNQIFQFHDKELTILAADDLSNTSQHALSVACELALNLGNCRLIHFHVHHQSRKEMEQAAQQLMDSLMRYELKKESRYLPSNIFATMSEQIKQTMHRRLGILEELVANQKGNSYQQVILYGNTLEKFEDAVSSYKPDLVVFGRHHFLHKKPLALGKMPAHAMLNLGRPTLSINSLL